MATLTNQELFTSLRDCREGGKWIRGHIVGFLMSVYPVLNTPGMMYSMTDDIPQRPSDDQVMDLLFEYTPLQRPCIHEMFNKVRFSVVTRGIILPLC